MANEYTVSDAPALVITIWLASSKYSCKLGISESASSHIVISLRGVDNGGGTFEITHETPIQTGGGRAPSLASRLIFCPDVATRKICRIGRDPHQSCLCWGVQLLNAFGWRGVLGRIKTMPKVTRQRQNIVVGFACFLHACLPLSSFERLGWRAGSNCVFIFETTPTSGC